MSDQENEFDEIMDEARTGFDLRDRLAGVRRRQKTVTVFTDSETGAELGGVETKYLPGTDIVQGKRRWGVQGRLDELREKADSLAKRIEQTPTLADEYRQEIAALEEEMKGLSDEASTLLKKLQETALIFKMQALPDIIIRDTRRKARKALDIKGKDIPESMQEQYGLEHVATLLAASVQSWKDNSDGKVYDSLSVQQARDLRDYLPAGQFPLLDEAMLELSFQASIGEHATDSADF